MTVGGKLYLLPSALSDAPPEAVFPAFNRELITRIKHYVVENEKTARRFLKKLNPELVIQELELYPLNKYTEPQDVESYLEPCRQGTDMVLLSDAGCPGVADPGAAVVAIAHREQIEVIPLIGPSSILLALMASGMDGQRFRFHGYLPRDNKPLKNTLKEMERVVLQSGDSQIFMETPYRNKNLLTFLIKELPGNMELCIACDITADQQMIQTKTLQAWKKQLPDIQKKPCIFVLGKTQVHRKIK